MSHSLNERKILIPSGTGDNNIELILNALEDLMDGFRDGYYVYFDIEKTMGIHFNFSSGASSCRAEVVANGAVVDYTSNFTLTSQQYIYGHKSTNETVTYISFSQSPYVNCIYVLSSDGSKSIYGVESYLEIRCMGQNDGAYKAMYPCRTTSSLGTIAITKMPDILNSKGYDEFYLVIGTRNFSANNYLVNFNGEIFRIASMMRDNIDAPCFAFPVSDPA